MSDDFISTGGLVKEHMDDLTAKATSAFDTAISIINQLQSVGSEILNVEVNTDIDDVTQPSISVVWPTAPVSPVFPTIADPPLNLDYSEDPFVNELMDELQATLLADLQSGGSGLGATVEADIWNRETERNLQALSDAKDRISREWSETSWTLPDGVLVTTLYAMMMI